MVDPDRARAQRGGDAPAMAAERLGPFLAVRHDDDGYRLDPADQVGLRHRLLALALLVFRHRLLPPLQDG